MSQLNKKGMLPTELVQLILAVAGAVIVFIIFYAFFVPDFNKTDKTSEAYFNIVTEKLTAAEKGTTQLMAGLSAQEDVEHYLVYFGEENFLELTSKKIFVAKENVPNQLCICSIDENTIKCNYCTSLQKPATLNNEILPKFNILLKDPTEITYLSEKGHYNFKTSEEVNG